MSLLIKESRMARNELLSLIIEHQNSPEIIEKMTKTMEVWQRLEKSYLVKSQGSNKYYSTH